MNTRVPRSVCARCGYVTNAAGHLDDDTRSPKAGDMAICLKCAHVAKYGGDLMLVELTQQEVVDLSLDTDFVEYHRRVQSAIRLVREEEEGGKAL